MHALVHAADIQGRDGGVLAMASLFGLFPFLLTLYVDGGCQGQPIETTVEAAMFRKSRRLQDASYSIGPSAKRKRKTKWRVLFLTPRLT